ncbi:hypothetical protein LZG00_15770 [Rhodobacteraceae bacterium LMO-12]|nr:hypothetical protein [Rhodobacteraceae bacterium LMO-JJ12]
MAALPVILADHGITQLDAVGHRIVHGGEAFRTTTVLDEPTVKAIVALTPLAPLHNPANLLAVRIATEVWPHLPQVAVFDTAFHGTSHKYVAMRAAEEIGVPLRDLKIVSLKLSTIR